MSSESVAPSAIPYQPLPLFLAAAVPGILLDRWVGFPGTFWGFLCLIVLLAWLVVFFRKRQIIASLLLLALCFSVFGLRHHVYWNRFAENDIGRFAKQEGGPAAIRGTLIEMPRFYPLPPPDPSRVFETTERTVFTLHATALRDRADWIPVTGRVAVTVEGDRRELRIGDEIQLFGVLSKLLGPQNPDDFDYAAMLRNRRILCLLRSSGGPSLSLVKPGSPGLLRALETLRRTGRENLERKLLPENASKATAMILGIREAVDEETTRRLVETGTLHILAISGLHIGLVAATVGVLLRFFGLARRRIAVLLIGTVLVYLFLTDVRPPAIRATVLVCVVATAMFAGRRSLGMNALCGTALVVLVLNPDDLFQFGAQLSFFATGAFFWVPGAERIWFTLRTRFFKGKHDDTEEESKLKAVEQYEPGRWTIFLTVRRALLGAAQLFLISLVLWTVTMPLILSRIHVLTPVALAVNPLLWLPMTAALLGGFATMFFGSVPLLGNLLAMFTDWSFGLLFGMIELFHRTGGYFWMPGPPFWWLAGFYGGFAVFTFLPIRRPPKRFIAVALISWTLIGFCSGYVRDWNRLRNDRLTLSVYSIGHGNCVLITTPRNRTIICDVGCLSSPHRACDVMSRALWRLGKRHIDVVLLTHPDKDHYNGLVELSERFSIGVVLVSPYMFESLEKTQNKLTMENRTWSDLKADELPEEKSLLRLRDMLVEKRIPVTVLADGDDLERYGLADSIILHPPGENFGESDASNAVSLVLRFEHRGTGVLLPGDLDGRLVSPFLERKPMPTPIVMIPHHGGRSNQTARLLDWAKPELILISSGRFTHRDERISELEKQGFTVRSTYLEGMIEIRIDRHGVTPSLDVEP